MAALCASDPGRAAQLGANCPLAEQVARGEVPSSPAEIRDGEPGRGIVATSIDGGRLRVTFSDGIVVDVGPVLGPDGRPGDLGAVGAPGRGVAGTAIVDGRLRVTYSDGGTEDLGVIVGPAGVGITGLDGTSGRLLVTLSSGVVVDAGPLPPGPKGDQGAQGVQGAQGAPAPSIASVTRNYSDGATETCTRSGGSDTDPMFTCTRSGGSPGPDLPTPTTEGG